VDQVLQLLVDHQFFIKLWKCAFGISKMEYFGHVVSHENMCVDPKTIEAMKDWLHPKNLKILIGFLGLTSYYRNFI